MTQALLELADRVEKATGPDRNLDLAVSEALGLKKQRNGSINISLPLTSSLDAAMTLVPEGWWLRVTQIRFGMWRAELWHGAKSVQTKADAEGMAQTEALARTACALRARAASA